MRATSAPIRLAGILLGAALAGCTGGPSAQLAGEPGLFIEVKRYYDRYGLEFAGRCRTPELGGILRSRVLERSADNLVIEASYTFDDPRAQLGDQCRGTGRRVFTVARRDDDRLEVVEMTGTQHPKGIRLERIDESGVW